MLMPEVYRLSNTIVILLETLNIKKTVKRKLKKTAGGYAPTTAKPIGCKNIKKYKRKHQNKGPVFIRDLFS